MGFKLRGVADHSFVSRLASLGFHLNSSVSGNFRDHIPVWVRHQESVEALRSMQLHRIDTSCIVSVLRGIRSFDIGFNRQELHTRSDLRLLPTQSIALVSEECHVLLHWTTTLYVRTYFETWLRRSCLSRLNVSPLWAPSSTPRLHDCSPLPHDNVSYETEACGTKSRRKPYTTAPSTATQVMCPIRRCR